MRRFVDQARVRVFAGKGGNGSVSFQHMGPSKKRPDGGHGGRGGDVLVRACETRRSLMLPTNRFRAQDGARGGKQNSRGKNGKPLEILVPPGTVVHRIVETHATPQPEWEAEARAWEDEEDDMDETKRWLTKPKRLERMEFVGDLDQDGATMLLAKGGVGGRGNIDQVSLSYKFYDYDSFGDRLAGKDGEEFQYLLTLKSIADVGLVGYPNAGKSTLLGAISRAKPEVASYPFTTLHPHVGVVEFSDTERVTVADIPGLVDGAHNNRGLGHQFLRHIERTHILAYVVDCSLESLYPGVSEADIDPATLPRRLVASRIISRLAALVAELELYMDGLSTRPCVLILNKFDATSALEVEVEDVLELMMNVNMTLDTMQENQRVLGEEEEHEVGDPHELEELAQAELEGQPASPSAPTAATSATPAAEGKGGDGDDDDDNATDADADAEAYEEEDVDFDFPESFSLDFRLPIPVATHKISAKFGGGIADLVRDLRVTKEALIARGKQDR